MFVGNGFYLICLLCDVVDGYDIEGGLPPSLYTFLSLP